MLGSSLMLAHAYINSIFSKQVLVILTVDEGKGFPAFGLVATLSGDQCLCLCLENKLYGGLIVFSLVNRRHQDGGVGPVLNGLV